MTQPEPDEIATHWPISQPFTMRRADHGNNNDIFIIAARTATWYLKRLSNHPRWERDYMVRTALAQQDLPFAMPQTLLTRSHEPLAHLPSGSWEMTAALPGNIPIYGDSDQTFVCGAALGHLDRALARIGPSALPTAEIAMPTADGLADAFPDHPELERASQILASTLTAWQEATTDLPRQLVHGDAYASNMLIEDNRITGILDFEFCAESARAYELAVAIRAFAFLAPDTSKFLPLIGALVRGYRSTLPLTDLELSTLSIGVRYHEAISLAHWTARLTSGESSRAENRWRIDSLVAIDRWLTEHHDAFVEVCTST